MTTGEHVAQMIRMAEVHGGPAIQAYLVLTDPVTHQERRYNWTVDTGIGPDGRVYFKLMPAAHPVEG